MKAAAIGDLRGGGLPSTAEQGKVEIEGRDEGKCEAVRRHRGAARPPLLTALKIPRPHIFFIARREGGAGIE